MADVRFANVDSSAVKRNIFISVNLHNIWKLPFVIRANLNKTLEKRNIQLLKNPGKYDLNPISSPNCFNFAQNLKSDSDNEIKTT